MKVEYFRNGVDAVSNSPRTTVGNFNNLDFNLNKGSFGMVMSPLTGPLSPSALSNTSSTSAANYIAGGSPYKRAEQDYHGSYAKEPQLVNGSPVPKRAKMMDANSKMNFIMGKNNTSLRSSF